MKILCAVEDTSSHLTDVRLRKILTSWAIRCGSEVQFKNLPDCDGVSIAWSDIVVIQRVTEPYAMWVAIGAKQLGKKVIFEIDDLLTDFPDFFSSHKARLAGYASGLKRMLPYVDCVTVTTEKLAKEFPAPNRAIVVIPTCTDDDDLGNVDFNTWQNDRATLIVASSDNVRVDFILEAIKSIILRSDIVVSIVVIGPIGAAFEKVGIKFDMVPKMSYSEFKAFIRTINNPIGLIPLDESTFSSCKSPIKYIDYSFAGIPVICSNVLPYSVVVENNGNGLLVANDTFSWIRAIESLVQCVDIRMLIAKQAHSFVKNSYGLDNGIDQWNGLFIKLATAGFYNGKPQVTLTIRAKIVYIRFLLSQMYSLTAYRAAFKILKRDGLRAFAARLIRGLL